MLVLTKHEFRDLLVQSAQNIDQSINTCIVLKLAHGTPDSLSSRYVAKHFLVNFVILYLL